jgi:PAS domain S-box-containing protein
VIKRWKKVYNVARRYGMAVIIIAIAVAFRWLIDPVLNDHYPAVTLFGGIAVAVWSYGYRPAVLAALVGYVAIDWFFVEPRQAFVSGAFINFVPFAAYALSSAVIITTGEAMRRARYRAEFLGEQRERDENSLRELTQQLQIVTDTMAAPVTRCSRDLRYLWVSKPYANWIGRSAEQIIGKPIIEIIGSAAFEQLKPHFDHVLAANPVRYEKQVNFKGLGQRWINAVYTPTYNSQGECDGWVAVVVDIDQHKRADQLISADLEAMTKLRELVTVCATAGENFHECLLLMLDTAIALTGSDKGTLQLFDEHHSNLKLVAHRGFEEPFLRFFARVDGEDAAACGQAMRTSGRIIVEDVTQSKIFAGQASLKVPLDAGVRAVQSTPLISSAGTLIGMLSTHSSHPRCPDERELRLLDLLARQAADYLERVQIEGVLHESENKYRSLFESIDQGFCTAEVLFDEDTNPVDCRFLLVNPAFERQTGITQLIGRRMSEIAPKSQEYWLKVLRNVALTGEAIRFETLTAEWGRHFYVHAWRIGREEERKIAVLFNDITDRKRAEEILRDYAEHLKEADRRKDEFLATLAHELRNPLAPIGNALEIMKQPSLTAEIFQQARGIAENQLKQIVRLVDDLLDVSRITRGRIELQKRRVTLKSIVTQALEISRPHIEGNEHALSVSLPSETIYLDADPVRMTQVLSNLINNSCKYTEPRGRIEVRAQIEKTVPDSKAELILSVKDNGIGIAPGDLPRLFEIFSQVESSLTRSHGGLGIGLSLVRGLVEMHGGTVQAKSEGIGKGSEFIVRLPVLEIEIVASTALQSDIVEVPDANIVAQRNFIKSI